MSDRLPEIRLEGDAPALRCAADELARCLAAIDGRPRRLIGPGLASGREGGPALRLATAEGTSGVPAVRDRRFDDAFLVDVEGDRGIIAGSNARSVLLGAYRYLHELGCRWVRPGPDGELLPRRRADGGRVRIREQASYRHRGICIEGAVGWAHVRNIIEWMPRVGLNSYFIQFREAYTFFDRWYRHPENPLAAPGSFDVAQARELVSRASGELERRGLLHHAVGHGWTCEPFGMPGLGWEKTAEPLSEAARPFLAEVGGRRELWEGLPLNTNLCTSQPQVRRILAAAVAEYAEGHPEVDVLHVWLADGANNSCECPSCRQARPADFYVMILNEVDRLLTERGIDTRIVFLAYVDLLWPPERERIANPDRFILMFAPITRTYSTPFRAHGALPALPAFERNRLVFPRSVEENLAFLDAWRKSFGGDAFDFDYHFMWDHVSDPGHAAVARVLHADVAGLADLGLDGLVSCQVQRASLPTGFCQYLLGRTLWDRSLPLEQLSAEYHEAAFGADGLAVAEYLARLTELFDPPTLRGERAEGPARLRGSLPLVPALVSGFRPVIARNLDHPDPCRAASWRYLDEHADITLSLAGLLGLAVGGQAERAKEAWAKFAADLWRREATLGPVLDTWLVTRVLGSRLVGWLTPPAA